MFETDSSIGDHSNTVDVPCPSDTIDDDLLTMTPAILSIRCRDVGHVDVEQWVFSH